MLAEIPPNDEKLLRGMIRFNAKVFGLVLGIVLGLIIFIGTNWLLIKGGPTTPDGRHLVGPHLELLGQFFIGYRVSFLGSIIGFLYGFAFGTLCGAAIGWIYNKIVDFRMR
jgi:hypothetical protein